MGWLSEEEIAQYDLRYSPDQPRDEHGRFGYSQLAAAVKEGKLTNVQRAPGGTKVTLEHKGQSHTFQRGKGGFWHHQGTGTWMAGREGEQLDNHAGLKHPTQI